MSQQLIKAFNEVMSNKKSYVSQKEMGHIGVPDDGEGNEGEYNERFVFYKHKDFPEGVFLRETLQTDSYGYDESIVEVKFVEGKEKVVIVFEPIK